MENIWVGQFDNLVVYGIAADGISPMKNWIKVNQECLESIDKLLFVDSNSNSNSESKSFSKIKYTNNLNLTNPNEIYRIVYLNQIKITWTESIIPVNIEVVYIQNNVQRYLAGMTTDVYSN